MTDQNEEPADGEEWDGSTWVNVDRYGHWEPSAAERTRALVLLGVLLGLLLLAAGFASLGSGRGSDEETVAATSTTTATTEPTTTTTTEPSEESLDGVPPPEECTDDDRDAEPMRGRGATPVIVLNGVGSQGLAGDTSGRLENLGYVAEAADAPERADTSTVTYTEGYCVEALRVAEDLGLDDVDVQVSNEPFDRETTAAGPLRIEVVLGRDHFAVEG